jgi:hypothetical protein
MMLNAIYLLHRFPIYRYSLHNFLTQNYYFPKGSLHMSAKNGFLLVELMVGLAISIFFILIITHYIIEVKITQQHAIKTIEVLSLSRNQREKIIAHKNSDTNV